MTPQTTRPAGVVLSAILLGVAACFLLLGAAFSIFASFFIGHVPTAAMATPGVTPPPSGLLTGIMLFYAFIQLAFTGWATTTLVGLVRMRNWARISIIVIGGCLAFLGLIAALGTGAVALVSPSMPMPPTANPAALHAVLLLGAFVWLVVAAVGVWWLVYFALRSTRDAFTAATAFRALTPNPGYAQYPPPPSPLDFSVAQPLEIPSPPAAAAPPPPAPYAEPPIPYYQPVAPATPKRPISITVIAVLLLIGAFFLLIDTVLPLPMFFFGLMMHGWPAHLMLLAYAIISLISGIRLLHLQKPAWFLTLGFYAMCALNTLFMLLPSVRTRLIESSTEWTRTFSLGVPNYEPNQALMSFFMVVGTVFSLFFSALITILLLRARWAFELPPQPTSPQ